MTYMRADRARDKNVHPAPRAGKLETGGQAKQNTNLVARRENLRSTPCPKGGKAGNPRYMRLASPGRFSF